MNSATQLSVIINLSLKAKVSRLPVSTPQSGEADNIDHQSQRTLLNHNDKRYRPGRAQRDIERAAAAPGVFLD